MAGLIPQTFIDDLLDRIDIVDVVDSRVKLKKNGKNYSACCPFHDEKTPSFTVSPDKQFYYCFGCGASGTALGFVLEYDHAPFPEAVETLAKMAGVEVPRETQEQSPQQKQRKQLYSMLEQADEHFRKQLRSSPARQHPVNYLQGRGLSGTIARDFGIGYAPPGWDNLLKALSHGSQDTQTLINAGLVVERPEDKRQYDRFRNRIMFPIRDVRGRVIGFGGRVLSADEKPKYLNSPETPVFHKGRELYGLYEARQAHKELPRLLVVEGYMDVVALAQFGIRYGVATLGTACGEDHLTLAFKHTSEVVFCFDGDNAGRKAAQRALENSLGAMQDGRQVKFLFLPDGEDPDTLIRQIGAEKFTRLIDEKSLPLEEFLFDSLAEGIDTRSMEGRARYSKRVAPHLHRLPNGVFKELMFASLAERTGLGLDTLMELVEMPEPQHQYQPEQPTQTATPKSKTNPTHSEPYRHTSTTADYDDYGDNYYHGNYGRTGEGHKGESYSSEDYNNFSEPSERQSEHSHTRSHITPEPPSALKLPPAKLLCAMLLQHPELALTTPETPTVLASEDPQLRLFRQLLDDLSKRPGSSTAATLLRWTRRPDKEQQALKELANIDLIHCARLSGQYDIQQEYLDTLQQLEKRLTQQKQQLKLKETLRKNFNDLSESDKQLVREHYANLHKR